MILNYFLLLNLISFAFAFIPFSHFHRQSFHLLANPSSSLSSPLSTLFTECEQLGDVRFVVVSAGAILESIGSFSNLRWSEGPKGRLATFSTTPSGEPNSFELHVRENEVAKVAFADVDKPGKVRLGGWGEGWSGAVYRGLGNSRRAGGVQRRQYTGWATKEELLFLSSLLSRHSPCRYPPPTHICLID